MSRARSKHPRASRVHGSPWVAIAFLAPYLVLFTMFIIVPAIFGLWISLHEWDFSLPGRPFVGLQNYADLFDEDSPTAQPCWNGM